MARPRLPEAKAIASGAALHDPKRFKGRKTSKRTRELGEPYSGMTPEQCQAWAELAYDIPWLNSSHRPLVRVAACINAKFDLGEDVSVSAMKLLVGTLSKLGATPVDETKVNHGDDGDGESAEDKFFN